MSCRFLQGLQTDRPHLDKLACTAGGGRCLSALSLSCYV